jgi:hypothetical protein
MPLAKDGRSKDRQKTRQHFHHWASQGTQHRRDDRAWPDEKHEIFILRLHKKKDQYVTRLKTSDPERGLLVIKSAAKKDGSPVEVRNGDKLMLAWVDESGEHVLPAVIAKVMPEDPPQWVLKQIGIPITKQIRRFARLRDVAPIYLSQGSSFVEALRLDLSEGGLKAKIPSNVDFEEGEEITVKTKVGRRGHQRELVAKAKVAKVFNRAGSKEVGISFLDLPESDREFIRRHIYERQIHERKLRSGADD